MTDSADRPAPEPALPAFVVQKPEPAPTPAPTSSKKSGKASPAASASAARAPITDAEPAPQAPFPIGARVRYLGTQRLFAGYQAISILEPGREYVITETAGAYSFYSVDVIGVTYMLAIAAAAKAEWALLAA